MIQQKRLIRIESSLTPKQAVVLWLRQECKGKTSWEYARFLLQHPPSAAPRARVEKQVVDAIQEAMKGQDPTRIHQALRQAQMHTDFLILLVNRTNCVILDDSRCRWLQIALLCERLHNLGLSDLEDEEEAVNEWAGVLRQFLTEVLSLQAATELIRDKYFGGECFLLKDVLEDLEQQTKMVRSMMTSYDRVATSAGKPELSTDSGKLRETVNQQASQRAGFIVALAKSKMLDDFGENEAADVVMRPYFLESLE